MYYSYKTPTASYKFDNLYDLIFNATYGEEGYSTIMKAFCYNHDYNEYLTLNPDKTALDLKKELAAESYSEKIYRVSQYIWFTLIPELKEKFKTSDYVYCAEIDNIIYIDRIY